MVRRDGMLAHFTSKTLRKNDGGPLMHTVNKQRHLLVSFNFDQIEFIRVLLCVVFVIIMALMDGIN